MMGNDWDLYEIVRSSAGAAKEGFLDGDSSSFPVLVDTMKENHVDPVGETFHQTAQANPTIAPSIGTVGSCGGLGEKLPLVDLLQQQPQLHIVDDYSETNRVGFQVQATRRTRTKQQIKVKVRVKVETHSKALRSWRKYGQKPIKGSPNPRSYYRCKRSKVCAAKKQVELSHDNPDEYIVTYIGIHTHGLPTALRPTAGTTRIPLPPCSTSPTTAAAAAVVTYPTPTSISIPSVVPSIDGENHLKDGDSKAYPEDDDVILIPNNQIADELFMAMHGFWSGESQSPVNNPFN